MPIEKRTIRSDIPGSDSYDQSSGQQDMQKLTVGVGISLSGEISACQHLVVEGRVTASLRDAQRMDIMPSGEMKGEVEIENAEISGYFEGDLTVFGQLVVRETACVVGNIQYGSLCVDPGARIVGTMSVMQAAEQQQMPVSQDREEMIRQDNMVEASEKVTPLYDGEQAAEQVDDTSMKAFAG